MAHWHARIIIGHIFFPLISIPEPRDGEGLAAPFRQVRIKFEFSHIAEGS